MHYQHCSLHTMSWQYIHHHKDTHIANKIVLCDEWIWMVSWWEWVLTCTDFILHTAWQESMVGRNLLKFTIFECLQKYGEWIDQPKAYYIINTNLRNHRWYTNFAKLSPIKLPTIQYPLSPIITQMPLLVSVAQLTSISDSASIKGQLLMNTICAAINYCNYQLAILYN